MSISGQSFNNNEAGAYATLAPGNAAGLFTGAFTVAVLAKVLTGTTGGAPFFGAHGSTITSDPSGFGALFLEDGHMYSVDDFSSGYGSGLNDGVWRWYVISKPAGSAHYRFHYADLASLTWSHGESSGAANHGDKGTAVHFTLACAYAALGYGNITIAAGGVWQHVLSDAQIQDVCTQAALDLVHGRPKAGWLLPEAEVGTAGSIVDFTGGGADETARQYVVADADPTDYDFTTTSSLWPASVASESPSAFLDGDTQGITTATLMRSTVAGTITHVRFLDHGTAGGTVQGAVWSGLSGSNSTSASTVNTTAEESAGTLSTGSWRTIALTTPLHVSAGDPFIVGLRTHRPGGDPAWYWSAGAHTFDSSKTSADGYLIAPGDGDGDGRSGTTPQGRFRNPSFDVTLSSIPADTWNANKYYVDVVFVPDPPVSLFTTQTPHSADADGGVPRQLGMQFSTSVAGSVTGWRQWVPGVLPTTMLWQLWRVSDQTLLAQVDVKALGNWDAGAWASGALDTPILLSTSESYVVCNYTTSSGAGQYVYTDDGTEVFPLTNGPLTSPWGMYSNGHLASDWIDPPGSGDGAYAGYFFADVEFMAGATPVEPTGSATSSSTVTITAAGERGVNASAPLSLGVSLTASGAHGFTGSASLSVGVALTASGVVERSSGATLAATTAISATGSVGLLAGADVQLGVDLVVTGSKGGFASPSIAATVLLTASGGINVLVPPQPPADVTVRVNHVVTVDVAYRATLKSEREVTLQWQP